MSVTKNLIKMCSQLSVVSLLAFPSVAFGQVVPLVAENGVAFGSANDDPLLRKGVNSINSVKELQLDVGATGALSMFSGLDPEPTFRAGEGHSGTVEAGKWYRIAKSTLSHRRTSAVFNLRSTTGNTHDNITFRAGMAYSAKSKMAFTLLSNSRFNLPVFSEVRYLTNGTYDDYYLEVKIARIGHVSYSIMENLGKGGWEPVDWVETTSIPTGYTETKYELDKLFVVAGQTPVLSVDRSTGVAIDGGLTLNGSSVMTEASLNTVFGNSLEFGVNSSAPGVNAFAGGEFSNASGDYSFAYGKNANATGNYSFALSHNTANGSFSFGGGAANTVSGDYSSVFGVFNNVSGHYSFASGIYSYALGSSSAVFGSSNSAIGNTSAVFGTGNIANNDNSMLIGKYSEGISENPLDSSWKGNALNSVFEIGIGSSSSDRKNAMTVMQDGTIELGKDQNNEVPLKVKSDGSVILNGALILKNAQGDIPMGIYGQ